MKEKTRVNQDWPLLRLSVTAMTEGGEIPGIRSNGEITTRLA